MRPALRFSLLLCCCPLLAAAAPSATVSLDDLVKNSPFAPPGQSGVAGMQNASVEFHGVIKTPAGTVFGFYDTVSQTGAWVTQGQKDADFVVRSYDPATGLVAVNYHGQNFSLTLAPAQVMVGAGAMPSTGKIGSAQPLDPKRIDAIMLEVKRRRALREGNTPAAGNTNTDGATTRQGNRGSRRQQQAGQAGGNGQ